MDNIDNNVVGVDLNLTSHLQQQTQLCMKSSNIDNHLHYCICCMCQVATNTIREFVPE